MTMGQFKYESQGTNTYLVYEIGIEDEIDSMSLGMLTNNKIPGIAEASFLQVDTTKYIKFNVSSKIPVSQLFSGPVNKKRLVGVFTGIIDAMLSAEDYMLDPNSLLLDLDYIMADVSTCESVLVCIPVANPQHKNPELGVFFKNIIFNTQFDQTENCDHVAQIINYLNTTPVLSLSDFKALLDGITKPKEVKKVPQPRARQEEANTERTNNTAVKQPPANPAQPVVQQVLPQQLSQPHEATNVQAPVSASDPVKLDETMRPQNLQVEEEEKPISMFYLLQHYNKENAAKYKAQKDAKKEKKTDSKTKRAEAKNNASVNQIHTDFAIPGQKNEQGGTGFAVPGQNNPAVEAKPVQPVVKGNPQPAVKQAQSVVTQQPISQKPSKSISFGETTVLGGSRGETTVLGAAVEPAQLKPYLIRSRNNEKIPLNKPVFRIGKERSYVDYFIGDNTAISRSHANIIIEEGMYFVVDTNSTNHTYVNGVMIQSNVKTEITSGAKLKLANEDFTFVVQ